MRKYSFLCFIFFIFLSCTSPYADKKDDNKNNNTEKDNSELTLKERAGKYLEEKKTPYYDESAEVNISEQGVLSISITKKVRWEVRTITSNIDISDQMNNQLLGLKVNGVFHDSLFSDKETSSEVSFIFLSPQTISVSFFHDDYFYIYELEKV